MAHFKPISFYILFLIFSTSFVHSKPTDGFEDSFFDSEEKAETNAPVGLFKEEESQMDQDVEIKITNSHQHHIQDHQHGEGMKRGDLVKSPEDRDCTTGDCPIASKSTGWSCQYTYECRNSPLGEHSICNQNVSPPMPGGTGQCSCYDWHKQSSDKKDVRPEGSRCTLVRKLHDICDDSRDCQDTNTGEAECGIFIEFHELRCQCKGDWVEVGPETCAPVAKQEGDTCSNSQQCSSGTLGPLSKCTAGRCKCDDTVYPYTLPTIYYKSKCYYARVIGDPCQSDEECQGSIHPKAYCKGSEAYLPNTKTCQCDEGKCDGPPEPDTGIVSTSKVLLIIPVVFLSQFIFNF